VIFYREIQFRLVKVEIRDTLSKLSAGDIERPVGIARLGEAIDGVHGANVRLRWVTIKKHLCIEGERDRERRRRRLCDNVARNELNSRGKTDELCVVKGAREGIICRRGRT
jgi:hypothetical protein